LGAVAGAAGGALGELAGPLAGRLAAQAFDGVLPEVAVSGLAGAAGGAATGAGASAVDYGMTCGSTRSGCSVSGLASAAGGGAAGGAIAGAAGGAGSRAFADSGEGAPAQPRAGEDDAAGCPATHSFVGSTKVLLADGKTKSIGTVKVGDKVADAVPGSAAVELHSVARVIVTKTDHDFVKVTVKRLGKVAAVAATAVAAATLLAGPAQAATITTTYHHPFYDVTQSAFVDADQLKPGDLLQSTEGAEAQVTSTHLFHATTTTYDLTIDGLHTYYILAGTTPILVHNCNGGQIGYNSDELSSAAHNARVKAGIGPGRNVAAANVEGLDEPVIGFSKGGGYHSENDILGQLAAKGIDPSQITELYSERQPCSACGPLLDDALSPGTPVTWSVPWGDNVMVNSASNELLRQMIAAAGGR
jgi:hypothetical protein